MPKSTSSLPSALASVAQLSAQAAAHPAAAPTPATPAICDKADALFRTAAECCRQHVRYARLIERDACDAEQRTACQAAKVYDDLLRETIDDYERAVARARGGAAGDDAAGDGAVPASANGNGGAYTAATGDADWFHRATRLLFASREYLRHQDRCDGAVRGMTRHTPDDLDALSAEYELGASALLALHQAVDGYRKGRPQAELKANGRPPS